MYITLFYNKRLTEEFDIKISLLQFPSHKFRYPQPLASIPDTAQDEKHLEFSPAGHVFSLPEVLTIYAQCHPRALGPI